MAATSSETDRAWKLMESLRFCMFSTWTGKQLRSRPMGAFVRRSEEAIYFFTDVRAYKDEEISAFPQVCLAFGDSSRQKYVSVSGIAEVISDREKIRELWSNPAKIWWDSPDDSNIRLIRVTPQDAEYWDTPGNVIENIKVVFQLATGVQFKHGDHKKVSL